MKLGPEKIQQFRQVKQTKPHVDEKTVVEGVCRGGTWLEELKF